MDNNPSIPTQPTMPQPGQTTSTPNLPPTPPPSPKSPNRATLIETIILVVVCLIAAAAIVVAVIFYINWDDAQTNLDGKIDSAVATAVEEQKQIDEDNFAAREKIPNNEFTGPSDYGSLSFMYPKTWSTYIAKDASTGGDFEAYFNPIEVSPVSENTINALRVHIYDRPIDQVRSQYDSLVRNGSLTSSVYTVGDITGTKYEGAFSRNITGIAIMIKINDKTAVIRTDALIFRTDFEALIATIRTN